MPCHLHDNLFSTHIHHIWEQSIVTSQIIRVQLIFHGNVGCEGYEATSALLLATMLTCSVEALCILKFKLIRLTFNVEVISALYASFIYVAFDNAFETHLKGFIVRQGIELGFCEAWTICFFVWERNHSSQVKSSSFLGLSSRLWICPLYPLW